MPRICPLWADRWGWEWETGRRECAHCTGCEYWRWVPAWRGLNFIKPTKRTPQFNALTTIFIELKGEKTHGFPLRGEWSSAPETRSLLGDSSQTGALPVNSSQPLWSEISLFNYILFKFIFFEDFWLICKTEKNDSVKRLLLKSIFFLLLQLLIIACLYLHNLFQNKSPKEHKRLKKIIFNWNVHLSSV